MRLKASEYYMWLRWLKLPLTIHVEPLRWTIGIAARWCVDGSGQHSHCYRAEIVLPVVRFDALLRWGPRPIPRAYSLPGGGFGDIGGRSAAKRHRAIEQYEDDEESENNY